MLISVRHVRILRRKKMIVSIKYKSGKFKFIPLATDLNIREQHVVVFTETGSELFLRDQVDEIKIVGV